MATVVEVRQTREPLESSDLGEIVESSDQTIIVREILMEVSAVPSEVVDVELELVRNSVRREEEGSHLFGLEDRELVRVRERVVEDIDGAVDVDFAVPDLLSVVVQPPLRVVGVDLASVREVLAARVHDDLL